MAENKTENKTPNEAEEVTVPVLASAIVPPTAKLDEAPTAPLPKDQSEVLRLQGEIIHLHDMLAQIERELEISESQMSVSRTAVALKLVKALLVGKSK